MVVNNFYGLMGGLERGFTIRRWASRDFSEYTEQGMSPFHLSIHGGTKKIPKSNRQINNLNRFMYSVTNISC